MNFGKTQDKKYYHTKEFINDGMDDTLDENHRSILMNELFNLQNLCTQPKIEEI